MVEQKKKISINPAFFNMKSSGKTKKKKKEKPHIKPNTIKRELLKKIKSHRKSQEKQNKSLTNNEETDNFEDEFMSSLNYLKDLVKKKREKKHRKTVSNREPTKETLTISNIQNETTENIETIENTENTEKKEKIQKDILHNKTIKNELRDLDIVKKDVPYGILKNGKKPTYRQYMKIKEPLQNKGIIELNDIIPVSKEFEQRKKRLQDFKKDFLIQNQEIKTPDFSLQSTYKIEKNIKNKLPKSFKKRKTFKTRRTLGKRGSVIGVLVKNNTTRKKVENDCTILQQANITTIKKYLRSHGLIKVGSSAPSDIMRKIYEDSFLTGDVYNKNSSVLLHNYLNVETED